MRILKISLSLVIIAVVAYGTYLSLFVSQLTKVSHVTIIGAQDSIKPQIEKLHGIKNTTSFWDVEVEKVAANIKKHDWVEAVEIKKVFPNEIMIFITQRQPHAVLNKGNGKFDYIDETGFVFGPAETADLSEKVILSGKSFNEKPELRMPVVELIKQLPSTGTLSFDDISEVKFEREKGYQILLSKTGMKIDLGKENLPVRIDRARKVVQYLESHQINASHVDADYAKKVLVKVRKGL